MNRSFQKIWRTSRRGINCSAKPLVMGILNVTPDSFSDGGEFFSIESALRQAAKMIAEGAEIIDIGGESTRPGSLRVSAEEEISRVVPVIAALSERFDTPVSIDTSKAEVADKAIAAGAEIINDISGLRFDENIAGVAAKTGAGLVLMHLRGGFDEMHRLAPVADILPEVSAGFNWSIEKAVESGVQKEQICLDIGIGFGKTFGQNLELLAKLDKICEEFAKYPLLVGTSRKSFIGRILGDAPVSKRSAGTLATNVLAVWHGADIVRVHDVRETVEALKIVEAIKREL